MNIPFIFWRDPLRMMIFCPSSLWQVTRDWGNPRALHESRATPPSVSAPSSPPPSSFIMSGGWPLPARPEGDTKVQRSSSDRQKMGSNSYCCRFAIVGEQSKASPATPFNTKRMDLESRCIGSTLLRRATNSIVKRGLQLMSGKIESDARRNWRNLLHV